MTVLCAAASFDGCYGITAKTDSHMLLLLSLRLYHCTP